MRRLRVRLGGKRGKGSAGGGGSGGGGESAVVAGGATAYPWSPQEVAGGAPVSRDAGLPAGSGGDPFASAAAFDFGGDFNAEQIDCELPILYGVRNSYCPMLTRDLGTFWNTLIGESEGIAWR